MSPSVVRIVVSPVLLDALRQRSRVRLGVDEVDARLAALFATGSAGCSLALRRGFLQEMMTAQAVKLVIIDPAFVVTLGVRA